MKRIQLLKLEQPIGRFYLGKLNINDLLNICNLSNNENNYDRFFDKNKISKISKYCSEKDATFPNNIILTINFDKYTENVHIVKGDDLYFLEFDENLHDFAEIVDGQYRILGLKNALYDKEQFDFSFDIPFVLMPNLLSTDMASIYLDVNSNQKQENSSFIYKIFGLSQNRSILKTCHSIVKTLQNDNSSPLYGHIRMLVNLDEKYRMISQSIFANMLTELFCNDLQTDERILNEGKNLSDIDDEKLIFRLLFKNNQDEIIYKILFNYFSGIKDVFDKEWGNVDQYIILTEVGIGGILKFLPSIFALGLKEKKLSTSFFIEKFTQIHTKIGNDFFIKLKYNNNRSDIINQISNGLEIALND